MRLDTKNDLLMVMIGLEAVSELLDGDVRMEDWRRDRFTRLFNQVAEEYNALVQDEDELIVQLIEEGSYDYSYVH